MNKIVIIIIVVLLLILLLGGGIWFLMSGSKKITWKKSRFGWIVGTDEKGVRRCYAADKTNCNGSAAAFPLSVNAAALNDDSPALVCGADHLAKWGNTGITKPNHWCNPDVSL
ncbi:MAG: hypothetical protein M0R33_15420 [Methylomonas sp.]|jgi:flagellar basal body-associated protein FliL|uniref:hypothetical protein n=1 Tax=Methylomonas sp. TaxID=418 RepID=UPI0025E232DC|nr:hypothetical protein [Methylomonas sp.]MCK9607832.1 hypothetical protein [Methylomonas sp.]